jgi:hypothetical protein
MVPLGGNGSRVRAVGGAQRAGGVTFQPVPEVIHGQGQDKLKLSGIVL